MRRTAAKVFARLGLKLSQVSTERNPKSLESNLSKLTSKITKLSLRRCLRTHTFMLHNFIEFFFLRFSISRKRIIRWHRKWSRVTSHFPCNGSNSNWRKKRTHREDYRSNAMTQSISVQQLTDKVSPTHLMHFSVFSYYSGRAKKSIERISPFSPTAKNSSNFHLFFFTRSISFRNFPRELRCSFASISLESRLKISFFFLLFSFSLASNFRWGENNSTESSVAMLEANWL